MLPPEGDRHLEDLAMDLATKASGLASQLPPAVRSGIGDIVRSMNCYYSNLIEGHNTHPRDIDRALAHADYSADPEKRILQQEAVAHIEVDISGNRGQEIEIGDGRTQDQGASPRSPTPRVTTSRM